ncbi:MAG: hypothetical protein OEV00_02295, partial [Acidobacteriota bacterium]|nr:hypothetical protein [Acidobacteriota bacterium]
TLILDLNDLPGTITFSENFSADPAGFHHEVGPGDKDRTSTDIGGLTCSPYVDEFFWDASGGNPGGGYFLWQDPADSFPNGTYSDLNDSILYSPVFKVGATSTTLSFDHEYLFAWTGTFRLDGVVVDYQVNGGSWQKLSTLPYDGSLIWNLYCNPLCNGTEFGFPCETERPEEGEDVFNQFDQGVVNWTSVGGAITGLTPGDLVRVRWRFGSMNSAVYGISTDGGYGLDNVSLTNIVELECDSAVNADTGCGVVFDSAGNLVEVCGDGDLLVEPTETWSVDVTLRNSSVSSAVNTTADLATGVATPLAASISSPGANFGTISAAGATATASYQFGVDAGAVCIDDIVFDVENITDNATSHPDKRAAFSVAVGGPGVPEPATQVTDPIVASDESSVTDLSPSMTTAAPANDVSLTFNQNYTNLTPQEVATQDTDPLIAENSSVLSTLSTLITDPNDAVSVDLDWTSLTHEKVTQCTRVYIRTPQGFNLTLKDFDEVAANPYDLLAIYGNPNGGPGQYQIGLEEEASGPCKMDAQISGTTLTIVEPTTAGSWTANAQISLWDGSGYTVVKPFGAADAQPYDVTSIYNAAGPGAYKLRVREAGGGGVAQLANAVLTATGIECDLGCSTFVPPAPPVADDIVGIGLRLTKGVAPDEIDFTFDSATCSADHAVVLYGNIGDYSGYLGAVDSGCDAGSGPAATVTHVGDDVWFIMHWVNQDGAAGSAGSSSAGSRSWNAVGLCGVASDDTSDGVCD